MSFIITGKNKDGKRYTIFASIDVLFLLTPIIIGILAAIVIPRCVDGHGPAKQRVAKADIATISNALDMYKMGNGSFPTTEQGFKYLLEKPSPSPSNWNGPYLKREPIDPWRKPYQYRCPSQNNQQSFDLWSSGPDGKDGTDDDITNWVVKR